MTGVNEVEETIVEVIREEMVKSPRAMIPGKPTEPSEACVEMISVSE